MKLLTKNLFLLAIALFAFACNNEEAQPNQQEEAAEVFEFSAENPPVDLPTAMQNSSTPEAQMINGFVASLNSISAYGAYFDIPEDAEFSTTPVSTSGGRTAALADVQVYTWTYADGQQSFTIAYQLSETTTQYKFEIFFNYNGEGFTKVLEGQESKDASRDGNLKWYVAELGADPIYVYSWKDNADGSFSAKFEGESYLLSYEIAADGSGEIEQSFDGVPFVTYTWNAEGTAGTVVYYDGDGNVTDTINWTA